MMPLMINCTAVSSGEKYGIHVMSVYVFVGPGGYESEADALDAITDAGPDKHYMIIVAPTGEGKGYNMKSYVSVFACSTMEQYERAKEANND
jgi:hypothetical protein